MDGGRVVERGSLRPVLRVCALARWILHKTTSTVTIIASAILGLGEKVQKHSRNVVRLVDAAR